MLKLKYNLINKGDTTNLIICKEALLNKFLSQNIEIINN